MTQTERSIVKQAQAIIQQQLMREGSMQIRGFGTFKVVERQYHNLHTDQPETTTTVRFKPSKILRDALK